METATLAGGCFWCTEAVFRRLRGVEHVVPGYSGGQADEPHYDAVSSGKTGHAEAIQFQFDPGVISYADILRIFFHLHDPTTMNRQGPDTGTQYRSVVFFHDGQQEKTAREVLAEVAPEFKQPIVTELIPYSAFFPAEDYHHNYFEKHQDAAYCQVVIEPKIKKLLEKYGNKVKSEYTEGRNLQG